MRQAAPQHLNRVAPQRCTMQQAHGFAAIAWQRDPAQQGAAPLLGATGQPARGFATAWQKGRAQQACSFSHPFTIYCCV
jgi:hypothetical protein